MLPNTDLCSPLPRPNVAVLSANTRTIFFLICTGTWLLFIFGHCKYVCSRRMLCSKRWIGMSASETLWRAFPEDQLLWVAGGPSLHKKTHVVFFEANMKWRPMWTRFRTITGWTPWTAKFSRNKHNLVMILPPNNVWILQGNKQLIYRSGGDGLEDGALAVAGECQISCWQVLPMCRAFWPFGVFSRTAGTNRYWISMILIDTYSLLNGKKRR